MAEDLKLKKDMGAHIKNSLTQEDLKAKTHTCSLFEKWIKILKVPREMAYSRAGTLTGEFVSSAAKS
jgi:hypothetical protein